MTDNPYVEPRRVKAALSSLGLRPSKGMGQNFLIDPLPLEQIAEAAELTSDDLVVEVGPGLGVLTWELLRRAGRVVSVELDRRLAERLAHEFGGERRFSLIQSDILEITPEQILERAGEPAERPYKLVANLPYAITSPLLRHFLEARRPPELMAIMVQWEVALRMSAAPPDMSILAHAIQLYAETSIVARVPAASFLPPPAVDSAIVLLRRRPAPPHPLARVPATPPGPLFRVIRAGFSQARKKLSNSLPGGLRAQGVMVEREAALLAISQAGVDAGRRAETLTLAEWDAIAQALPLGSLSAER